MVVVSKGIFHDDAAPALLNPKQHHILIDKVPEPLISTGDTPRFHPHGYMKNSGPSPGVIDTTIGHGRP
jgi:hypothetical protein